VPVTLTIARWYRERAAGTDWRQHGAVNRRRVFTELYNTYYTDRQTRSADGLLDSVTASPATHQFEHIRHAHTHLSGVNTSNVLTALQHCCSIPQHTYISRQSIAQFQHYYASVNNSRRRASCFQAVRHVVRPSVIPRDAIPLYLVQRLQWNLTQVIIMWVAVAEKVFKGQTQRSMSNSHNSDECDTVEMYASAALQHWRCYLLATHSVSPVMFCTSQDLFSRSLRLLLYYYTIT